MKAPEKPDLAKFQEELEYASDFKARMLHPGKWPTVGRLGEGFSFEKYERLSRHPDFRRIDFLATIRNPMMDEPLVRVSKPTAKLDVILAADLSLSLSCGFSESKIWQIAKLATLFGYTAFRMGDRFGFLGFDDRVRENWYFPPVHGQTIGLKIGEEIVNFRPSVPFQGTGLDFDKYLGEKKSLLILVSDFYFPPRGLQEILKSLTRHQILPIVLRQPKERRWPRGLFGVLTLKDSESRRERTVFFAPRTIRRFEQKCRDDEKEIRKIFLSLSTWPIFLEEVTPDLLLELLNTEHLPIT